MDVSIIIPALDEAAGIGQAIERALALQPREVLVVDGGSRDGTADIASTFSCRVLESLPGRSMQQNLGARHAQGSILLFLHADAWLLPNALEQIAEALDNPKVWGGAFCQRIEADGFLYRWLERGNAARVRLWSLAYGDQGLFMRRSVFEQVGGFPSVRLMEDVLLMRQLRKRGKAVLLPGPIHISARRWQKYGVVRQTARNWVLLSALRLGIPPDRLAPYYPRHALPTDATQSEASERFGWKNGRIH